jgi:hypothetical protein
MRRAALALALILAAPAVLPPAPTAVAGQPDRLLHLKLIYPTIRVACGGAVGSAVVVRSREIEGGWLNTAFTAAHVVAEGTPSVRIATWRDWSRIARTDDFPAAIARSDARTDAAVLTFTTPFPLDVAEIEWNPRLYIGTEIAKVGFGLDRPVARYDRGHVTDPEARALSSLPTLRIAAVTYPGDSGCGVFEGHKLVAVHHAAATRVDFGARASTEMIGYSLPIAGAFTIEDLR